MEFLCIISWILIPSLLILMIISFIIDKYTGTSDGSLYYSLSWVFLMFIVLFLIKYHSEPKAIDVYQGKTELKYEVVCDTKLDSTVVFKQDYE